MKYSFNAKVRKNSKAILLFQRNLLFSKTNVKSEAVSFFLPKAMGHKLN